MFTGIIEGLGTITSVAPGKLGRKLTFRSDFPLDGTKIGDSIAVNGACLTAVAIQNNIFSVDVSPETTERTTVGVLKTGDRVNLERAMRLSDRLDGHLVSGHIDGTGVIIEKNAADNAVDVTIRVPEILAADMIEKGSVAVDGISLTINNRGRDRFSISIIPHTARITTIGFKKTGETVNIETDIIGKYVRQFLSAAAPAGKPAGKTGGVDMALLMEKGFL
jgi:riboflavin synthase